MNKEAVINKILELASLMNDKLYDLSNMMDDEKISHHCIHDCLDLTIEYRKLKSELNKIEEQESIQKQKDELEDKLYNEMRSAWTMASLQRQRRYGYTGGDIDAFFNRDKEDKTDYEELYKKAKEAYEKVATTRTKPQCHNPFANLK